MSGLTILWLVLIAVFVVVEMSTLSLVSIWFAAASVVTFFVSLFVPSFPIQLIIFAIVSAVCLALFMKPLQLLMANRRIPTNADSNIGRVALVIEPATDGHLARVHLDGVDWSARCETPLEKGNECRILSITGATLNVESISHAKI